MLTLLKIKSLTPDWPGFLAWAAAQGFREGCVAGQPAWSGLVFWRWLYRRSGIDPVTLEDGALCVAEQERKWEEKLRAVQEHDRRKGHKLPHVKCPHCGAEDYSDKPGPHCLICRESYAPEPRRVIVGNDGQPLYGESVVDQVRQSLHEYAVAHARDPEKKHKEIMAAGGIVSGEFEKAHTPLPDDMAFRHLSQCTRCMTIVPYSMLTHIGDKRFCPSCSCSLQAKETYEEYMEAEKAKARKPGFRPLTPDDFKEIHKSFRDGILDMLRSTAGKPVAGEGAAEGGKFIRIPIRTKMPKPIAVPPQSYTIDWNNPEDCDKVAEAIFKAGHVAMKAEDDANALRSGREARNIVQELDRRERLRRNALAIRDWAVAYWPSISRIELLCKDGAIGGMLIRAFGRRNLQVPVTDEPLCIHDAKKCVMAWREKR